MRRSGGCEKVLPGTHAKVPVWGRRPSRHAALIRLMEKRPNLETVLKGRAGPIAVRGRPTGVVRGGPLVHAGIDGFYTFRAYFRTFQGPDSLSREAGDHAQE